MFIMWVLRLLNINSLNIVLNHLHLIPLQAFSNCAVAGNTQTDRVCYTLVKNCG